MKNIDINAYDALIFELDDVIYPEKDYLIQVYYLFAQFLEYMEQMPAKELVQFMKDTYEQDGSLDIFRKTQEKFKIDDKYKHNFDTLHQTARLPLKLLMYQSTLDFMKQGQQLNKELIILTAKLPEIQLNKIRQIEWNGLEHTLQVYFVQDLAASTEAALKELILSKNFDSEKTLFVDQVI